MLQQHDDTSQALLEAAHRLVEEHGPEALTVRRIATGAGMSTMNVYSRFGGKDGVIDELYVAGFRKLYAQLESVTTTDDLRDDLAAFAHAYRRFALDNPAYYGIMFRTSVHDYTPSPAATEVAFTGLDMIADRIALAQQAGTIHSSDDAVTIAAAMWATCHGVISLELSGVGSERIDWDAAFATAIRAVQPTERRSTS